MKRIYLDNNATTPLDPRLMDLFTSCAFTTFGNPSSIHGYGQAARSLLTKARDDLANLFGVKSQEIVFTATATEALNMLLRGFFGPKPWGHLVTSSVEHAAVYSTVQALEKEGIEASYIDVGSYGAVKAEQLEAAIRPDTRLIVLMAANNETGAISDIDDLAEVAKRRNIPFVVDGVALFGKEPFTLHPAVSAITFSGHKFYAPKGAGFTVVRKGLKLTPYMTGGHQEYGLRAGTENLASIVTMAYAAKLITDELQSFVEPMRALRDYFEAEIMRKIPKATINGKAKRLSNTSNICFEEIDGEALLMYLDLKGVAASLGSACSSGSLEPSRVLLNMGLTRKQALSSLRFSLSRFTTKEDIDKTVEIIANYCLCSM